MFIAGIAAALASAGWTSAAISGGYTFTGSSPQGLSVGVSIWDPGTGSQVRVKFGAAGVERRLKVATGYTYQIVCNPCQLFVSRPGVASDVNGSVVCGGVPRVASTMCSGSSVAESATETWWASGDYYGSPFFFAANPRLQLLQYNDEGNHTSAPGGPRMGEAMWNGNYCAPWSGGSSDGTPEIVTITATEQIDLGGAPGGVNSPALWYGDDPLVYDPLICWGTSLTDAPMIRGQIWDAVIVSKSHAMDADQTAEDALTVSPYDGRTWINFTDQYLWGSLWLMLPGTTGSGGGNYIY